MWTVNQLIVEIQALNQSMPDLVGISQEMCALELGRRVEELRNLCGTNRTSTSVRPTFRLTLMDSAKSSHREAIRFANSAGHDVRPDDFSLLDHVIVMPQGENFTAASISELPGLVRLDARGVEWMAHDSDDIKFLIIRFATGRLYVILNSYGIRALVPGLATNAHAKF